MNCLEKMHALGDAMLRTEEEFDGLLGMLQGIVAMGKLRGQDVLTEMLPDDPAAFDEELLNIAGFVLWLRSDDAPQANIEELLKRSPEVMDDLAQLAGIPRS